MVGRINQQTGSYMRQTSVINGLKLLPSASENVVKVKLQFFEPRPYPEEVNPYGTMDKKINLMLFGRY